MAGADELLATIEAIYAAGLDGDLWPQALAAVTQAFGGISAMVEVFDRTPFALREFHSFGVPPLNELKYLDQDWRSNPRIPFAIKTKPGDLISDYMVLDGERAIDRDPFYAGFLAPIGCRYCLIGHLETTKKVDFFFSVQRAKAQGHVDRAEVKQMELLLPHVRQAFDMTRRLRVTAETRGSLEHALDWLIDGIALLGPDGDVVYANEALQAMARRKDGLAIQKGRIELAAADARDRLERTLAIAIAFRHGKAAAAAGSDFPVMRSGGAPPYYVSVRPLPAGDKRRGAEAQGVAIVFVRDPASRNAAATRMLREVFGLTEAEASLAQALQTGIALTEYAATRGLSLNTAYTHLRRLREKTGCSRMPELIRKLNDVQVPLRLS
jgi:DNA-binding CsgD family transcriptional regulator/PAS domain-containing protein